MSSRRSSVQRAITGLAIASVLILSAPRVTAQWPTVLMFHGGGLSQPVLVVSEDAVALASAFRPAPYAHTNPTAASMADRRFIDVACFWGPPSNPAMNGVSTLSGLTPEMTFHHARFYPATERAPALVFVMPMQVKGKDRHAPPDVQRRAASSQSFVFGGAVSDQALTVLEKLGVPIGPRAVRASR
jgi:hypothetical protein